MKFSLRKWKSWVPDTTDLQVARRIVIAVVGGTITLIGIALIVLPGPAFVVIPIGLSILATQFFWARRLLDKARGMAARVKKKA